MDRRRFLRSLALTACAAVAPLFRVTASSPSPGALALQPKSTEELDRWYATYRPEPVLEPGLPIVDPHHHLPGVKGHRNYYRLEEMSRDLAAGHRVLATVYCEGHQPGFLTDGPVHLRSVGEVQRIVEIARAPLASPQGPCRLAAGIVSKADLTIDEEQLAQVLEAHRAAGEGRLRGVRQLVSYDSGPLGSLTNVPPHLLTDSRFRRGFAQLEPAGLSFDASVFHRQLGEVADLADAFPHTTIVLDHGGMLLGVEPYKNRREEEFLFWRNAIQAVAKRPNICVKIGGMGTPFFGFGFDRGARPATSEALARAWRPIAETCIEAFGTRRAMFESNYPVDRQSCGYVELWNAVKRIAQSFSMSEKQDLFYRTACRTYRLGDVEAACEDALKSGGDRP